MAAVELLAETKAAAAVAALAEMTAKLGIGLIYKTSYDKANRTSARAARGVGVRQVVTAVDHEAAIDRLREPLGALEAPI